MEETTRRIRIALLTSDEEFRRALAAALPDYRFSDDLVEARLAIVDVREDEAALIAGLPPDVPVLALVGARTFEDARAMIRARADDVLDRAAPAGQLRQAIEQLLFHPTVPRSGTTALSSELFYLRDVSQAASEGMALLWLFNRIVDIVARALGVDNVSLMLIEFDPETKKELLRIKAARGLTEEIIRTTRIELGQPISGLVAERGQAMLIADVEKAGLGIAASRPRYHDKGLLSVPIKTRRQTLGVLNVNNKAGGGSFDDYDLALLVTLCNQAALAIDNTWMYDRLNQHAGQLAELNKRLRAISQAKSELIVNLSHELKTPLTAIQGYVDLLRSGVVAAERIPEILAKVHDRTRNLGRLAGRLITFFALDSGLAKYYFQTFPFDVLVQKCLDDQRPAIEAQALAVQFDRDSLHRFVHADQAQYQELLGALLENAVKFNRPEGTVRLRGEAADVNGRAYLEVFVEDSGHGVPENLRETIFEEFRQTDDLLTAKPAGLGLGLAIARAISQGHGCRIRLVKSDDAGSVFAFTVPLETGAAES